MTEPLNLTLALKVYPQYRQSFLDTLTVAQIGQEPIIVTIADNRFLVNVTWINLEEESGNGQTSRQAPIPARERTLTGRILQRLLDYLRAAR